MEKTLVWLTPKKAIFLIVLIGVLVYANSLFNGFVWDDEEEIVSNTILHDFANLPQIFSGGTFNTGGAEQLSGWFFRPLRSFIIMTQYSIWGPNAFGFHFFQVALHILSAILLFKILLHLLGEARYKVPIATIFTLIFVVHPGLTEAVVYIAAASEVMYTFSNLLAFYLLLKATKIQSKTTKYLSLFSILLFAGVLIKESSMIIFPLILLYLFLWKVKDWKRWTISALVILVSYFFLRLVIVGTPIRPLQLSPISEAPLAARLMTIPLELFSYLRIIFFPKSLAISQHFVVSQPSLFNFILPLIVTLFFFSLLLFLAWKLKSKLMFFGLAWFILGLALISNIFPLDMTIAERWLYFPIIGLLIAFAGLLNFQKLRSPKVFIILLLIAFSIPILSLRTIIRNSNWKDGLTLYSYDIKITKDSFDLENNLGVELFRKGKISEAKPHFQRAIELNPKWHFAYNNLGAVYEQEKDYKKAKELYQKTLELSDYYLAYENLASLLLFYEEDAKGAKDFTQDALKKLPQNPKLWLTLALAEYKLGNQQDALVSAQTSYKLRPNQQAAYIILRLQQNLPIEF